MTSVGETLRRERLRKALGLEQISRETKISARLLDAIENDQFDALPGGVFAKSFVRQYARFLGLDEEELAADLEKVIHPVEELPGFAAPPAEPAFKVPRMVEWEGTGRSKSSVLPALAMVVAVMLVCSAVFAWWQRSRHSAPQGGYFEVASDGGLFAFGPGATFHGSMGGKPLNRPVVGMAETSQGGYYEVASDGGIFAFGPGATFHGSMGGKPLNRPVVGISVTTSGGYYEVASDGGIFAFGAPFHGSTGCLALSEPIVAMIESPNTASTGTGTACGFSAAQAPGGYQFVAGDGGVFSFGNGQFDGSLGGDGITDVVGMASG